MPTTSRRSSDISPNPLDSSDLVLVVDGGAVPKKLGDAVKAVGTVDQHVAAAQAAKDRQGWISDHIAVAPVCGSSPTPPPSWASWLGEDAGRLDGILATLTSTYGTGHVLTFADVEPFLGEAGGVPPWDFTDAIDAGQHRPRRSRCSVA